LFPYSGLPEQARFIAPQGHHYLNPVGASRGVFREKDKGIAILGCAILGYDIPCKGGLSACVANSHL
jgi:hypothetical protein